MITTYTHSVIRQYIFLCLMPLLIAGSDSADASTNFQQQRAYYLQAKAAIQKGRITTFKDRYAKITDYPLKPYLKYAELKRRLYLLPYEEVDQFLHVHEHSYLAEQLRINWLKTLAKRRHWHDYQSYYLSKLPQTHLKCLYLQARLNTGDQTALTEVAPLWNVGKSQPDVCTPVFKAWIKAGHLQPQIAWERHSKAISKRKRSLARYISRLMPDKQRKLAKLYQEVDRYPQRVKQYRRFKHNSPHMQEVILHGIKRYARRDALAALSVWQSYDAKQGFADGNLFETQEYLATQLAKRGHMVEAERLLHQTPAISSENLLTWLVRDALRNEEWKKVYHWLKKLSPQDQQSDRWMYWRARAMEKLNIDDPAYPTPQQIYTGLALTRGYYGFLSADVLGRQYSLIDNPIKPPRELITAVANLPGIKRARELFELNEINYARREWLFATQNLDAPALLASAKLAEKWRWHRKGIQVMVATHHWDDLQLRFPLAYEDHVHAAAENTDATADFLFAIARQESAFAADAKSPAGALGLMQLMPRTARQTARRAGMRYRYHDLLKPDRNINLGSRYLHQLLGQFNGNRILAAAAYNAGPHRVKKWLAKSDKQLPYDIWIETIPFKETRGYVQNVLAFSVIYGYRMGNTAPLITADEASNRL